MRMAESRVTTTGRHSRTRVTAEEARTIVGASRNRWRAANHRGRPPHPGRRRRRWLLAAGVAVIVAGVVALVPTGPPVPPVPDTSPPGPTALTADFPNGPPGNWTRIFADEFDDTALDTTHWLPCVSHGQLPYPAKCTGWQNELQTYQRDNVVVRDGALRLIGRRTATGYTSGAITTARDVFGFNHPGYSESTYRYGYSEVRFRAPPGPGMWPAVWGLPYNGDGDEIDIVEIIKGSAFFTLHTGPQSGGGHYEHTGTDFTRGWHIVGTDWQPGRITWYLDGKPVYTVQEGVPDQPFFLQANLAIGGDWPGPPDATTPFPASLDIDYIRVFQRRT
jgi:beta-glucanase (GH16 family)